jgi:hypothetical protein
MSKRETEAADPKTNGKGGGLLDGRLWREFPSLHVPQHHFRPRASPDDVPLSERPHL